MSKSKRLVALFLCFSLLFLLVPAAPVAALQQNGFPLLALNGDLVADANTQYITQLNQHPVTGLISVRIQVRNGSTGASARPLAFHGIGIALSYGPQIAPYAYNGDRSLFPAGAKKTGNASNFTQYATPSLSSVRLFGSQYISRDADGSGGMIGANLTCSSVAGTIILYPGETIDIVILYFMPIDGGYMPNLQDQFSYAEIRDNSTLIRLNSWVGNGSRFLYRSSFSSLATETFIVSPEAFIFGLPPR
jgi:hypothetical protein